MVRPSRRLAAGALAATALVIVATVQPVAALFLLLAPVVVGLPLFYIFKRVFEPFTLAQQQRAAVVEPSGSESSSDVAIGEKSSRRWTRRKVFVVSFFWLFVGIAFLPIFLRNKLLGEEPHWFMIIGYNVLGSFVILLFSIATVDLLDALRGLQSRNRRLADNVGARRAKAGLTVALYLVLVSIALYNSYQSPQIQQVNVYLEKLPACADDHRIVLVSDVHGGPLVGKAEIERLVAQINELNADTVALVGDIGDGTPEAIGPALTPFSKLEKRAFYVAGVRYFCCCCCPFV